MVQIDLKKMRKPMSVVHCKVPSNDIEWEDPAGKPKRNDYEMENDELEFCAYCEKIMKSQGVIYFPSIEIAKQAMSKIIMPFMKKHPDFVW